MSTRPRDTLRPDQLARAARSAVERARSRLLALRRPEGFWHALLETDASVTSEFLLACRHLGRVDEARERKIVNYLSARQDHEGGWTLHPHGPYSQETTIKAYFALKAAGVPTGDARLRKARALILEHGGVESSAVFTKVWLAMLGQMSWRAVPCLAPEIVLLPRWLPLHLGAMAYWCRMIIVPLSIVRSTWSGTQLPADRGVPELFLDEGARRRPTLDRGEQLLSIKRGFYLLDRAAVGLEPYLPRSLRARAMKAAERWMLDRLPDSDGLGAIIPSMLGTVLAFRALGRDWSDPVLEKAWSDLLDLAVETEDELWMQPCLSPVWDTALAVLALRASGSAPDAPEVVEAARWLLARRTTRRGDWADRVAAGVPAGAWSFQRRNDFYPDVDDTAVACMALRDVPCTPDGPAEDAIATAVEWIRGMQCRGGGWGAYDKDVDRQFLNEVPFADHGALLDGPVPDLTGRMLTCLGALGCGLDDPTVRRAVAELDRTQEDAGSWAGRWGIHHLYGTWSALEGLEAVGLEPESAMVRRGADWLESVQGTDGGWGESPESYGDRSLAGRGPSTASQTAWALLGLVAAGRGDAGSTWRGVSYLVERQGADGGWEEPHYTGTGFPNVLYLRYGLYSLHFPLMALGRWLESRGG